MKFVKFLKLLNNKINKYDKYLHSNPFKTPRYHFTVVWIDDWGRNNDFPLNDIK